MIGVQAIGAFGNKSINESQKSLNSALKKLSSGIKVAHASQGAAELAVLEKLQSQHDSMRVAERNVSDAISMTQVAEGALGEQSEIVSRMGELATQAANGTLSDSDRAVIQEEFSQLSSELDRISATTEFNGNPLLDGSSASMDIQVGVGASAADVMTTALPTSDTTNLGTGTDAAGLSGVDLSTQAGAQSAMTVVEEATSDISAWGHTKWIALGFRKSWDGKRKYGSSEFTNPGYGLCECDC
jgi:flagellin